jgi:hypothetical protein
MYIYLYTQAYTYLYIYTYIHTYMNLHWYIGANAAARKNSLDSSNHGLPDEMPKVEMKNFTAGTYLHIYACWRWACMPIRVYIWICMYM